MGATAEVPGDPKKWLPFWTQLLESVLGLSQLQTIRCMVGQNVLKQEQAARRNNFDFEPSCLKVS